MTSAESQKKYKEAHPGRKEEQQKRFHELHPRKKWEYRIKWMYGITAQEFEEKRISQGNKCAICLKEFIDTPCVDHNHATGKTRDLLCRLCNRALGLFGDSSTILSRASEYLKKHEETNAV